MEKPLCISYIRFSSLAQSEGSSVERQLELSRKYAEEHDLILDDKLSYRDLGKSAYSIVEVYFAWEKDLRYTVRRSQDGSYEFSAAPKDK